MNTILFDASSTSPISDIVAVAPGDCLLINAWGLAPGQTAQVFRVLVELGSIPSQQSGSCVPPPAVQGATIQTEVPYAPCNATVEVGQTPTENLTSILLQQPGFYRLHLTPAAVGTAIVEAVVLTGADACAAAAAQCCCEPQAFWDGSSTNPCLVITPGGPLGHSPVFSLDACCMLESFPSLANPVGTDELVVLSGGNCFRSQIVDVFANALFCEALATFPVQAPAAGDVIVSLDAADNCKRVDGETFVEFFETPWTGISANPNLTITPGGVNGHGPTFNYDLCGDLNDLPVCACTPVTGDLIPIIQAGNCTLATFPEVSACVQFAGYVVGALIAGDTVPVLEAGGACKRVPFADFVQFPLLAPNGSCVAPSYSFAASPDSGMFYTGTAVRIGDDNCADFIEVGASINIVSSASNISILATAGAIIIHGVPLVLRSDVASVQTITNSTLRLEITNTGSWVINATAGVAGEVLTTQGGGTTPVWQAVGTTPILAANGSCAAPTYSFAASPDSGMFYTGTAVRIGDDNCTDFIEIGASINITAAGDVTITNGLDFTVNSATDVQILSPQIALQSGLTSIQVSSSSVSLRGNSSVDIRTAAVTRLTITSSGAWTIGGTAGVAGQVITSAGAGAPPTWQTPTTLNLYAESSAGFVAPSAGGTLTFSIGSGASSAGTSTFALGTGANVSGIGAIAVGPGTLANAAAASAFGNNAQATATEATALGEDTIASAIGTLAAGPNSQATAVGAVAVGRSITNSVAGSAHFGSLDTNKLVYSATGVLSLIGTGAMFHLPNYTAATLPTAANNGGFIYVTDESGGAVPAFSDTVNWRRVTDRAIVT